MALRSPIDPDRYVGTVTLVSASQIQANLPLATARPEKRGLSKGAVGDFVFVDCERVKLLGRIVEVRIPDAERLTVEPQLGTPPLPHPIGRIQLLASVAQSESRLSRGLKIYPRIGDGVYLADRNLLAEPFDNAVASEGEITLALGTLDAADGIEIRLPRRRYSAATAGFLEQPEAAKAGRLRRSFINSKKHGARPSYSIPRESSRRSRMYPRLSLSSRLWIQHGSTSRTAKQPKTIFLHSSDRRGKARVRSLEKRLRVLSSSKLWAALCQQVSPVTDK